MSRVICISEKIGLDGETIVLTYGKLYQLYKTNSVDEYLVVNDLGAIFPYSKVLFNLECEFRNNIIDEILC